MIYVFLNYLVFLLLKKALHKIDVDVLVAPYEADAQLAYLSKKNLVQLIITEDSDLIIFGCKRILFKMRHDGSGSLFEEEKFFTFSRTLFNSVDSKQRFRWLIINEIELFFNKGYIYDCFLKKVFHFKWLRLFKISGNR